MMRPPGRPGRVGDDAKLLEHLEQVEFVPDWARKPRARRQNVRNDGRMNNRENTASSVISDAGTDSAASGSIQGIRSVSSIRARSARLRAGHHGQRAANTPPADRNAVTARIIAHVTAGWPRLGKPLIRHRGQYRYVAALLPGHREPAPILRLRYQCSANTWAIGLQGEHLPVHRVRLPGSFGPVTGTPEQGNRRHPHPLRRPGHPEPDALTVASARPALNGGPARQWKGNANGHPR
jgi:hypothetical protein